MSVIIRLQGLPLSAASADIRTFFSGLRIPDGAVNIVGGEDGDAFIGFATDDDAGQAMRKNFGHIHNAEVRLFLSSQSEMREVIDNARSAPPVAVRCAPLLNIDVPSILPRYHTRLEREEHSRFSPGEEPSRFGIGLSHRCGQNSSSGKEEYPRYDEGSQINVNSTPFFPIHGRLPPASRAFFGNEKREQQEEKQHNLEKQVFQTPRFDSEKIDQRASYVKGDERRESSLNLKRIWDREPSTLQKRAGGYYDTLEHSKQEKVDKRIPREYNANLFGNSRDDLNIKKEERIIEESWRRDGHPTIERQHITNGSIESVEEPISFFGRRGTGPKMPLLPPPSLIPLSSLHLPNPSSNTPSLQSKKEEVFVELTRLPPDLLRPSVLENFLSPSIPLTLSSVKVVYSPEGIHLSSLVRFTSAMDAFNALKKDGEQGVKIRPSTKESFESAQDGPPITLPHLAPSHLNSLHSLTPQFSSVSHIGIGFSPEISRMNTMSFINSDERKTMGNVRGEMHGGIDDLNEGRGERRGREGSPQRGRREDKRRSILLRSISPRSKKLRGDRICIHVSNLPFRVKEPEIRRMLGPGLNPYAIKKIFNEDNAPSDVWIMEFSSEPEAIETVRRRMELGGRIARLRRIDEEEADKLLKQKFKSPPRRTEKEEDQRHSFDEKVRMQQEAIEREKTRMNGPSSLSIGQNALAGAFSAPVFTTNRGFMRGGRGGGRGMRGDFRGSHTGGLKGAISRGGLIGGMRKTIRGAEKNCLLISNMPPLPTPQVLLEQLRVIPSQFVRIDQIAPDAAIIELKSEVDAVAIAENASADIFPYLNGRKLIVAAMARVQIEEEFNLRGGHMNELMRPRVDPELVRTIGESGCVIGCEGFPRDLAIDEMKRFFEGYPIVESSVRMRMEGGEGTGECMLALRDRESARSAVESLNGHSYRGKMVTLFLL